MVVTDHVHSGLGNGLQFIEEMKKAHPSVPVIMASAMQDQTSFKRQALELGAWAYMALPFTTVQTFLAVVDDVLSHAGRKAAVRH